MQSCDSTYLSDNFEFYVHGTISNSSGSWNQTSLKKNQFLN